MTRQQLLDIKRQLSKILFGPNSAAGQEHSVVGLGVALRSVDPNPTKEFCLEFYVKKKGPLAGILPPDVMSMLDGVPTEVVQVGRFKALSELVRPGFGLGYEGTGSGHSFSGTLGAVLEDGQLKRYALSANHVLSKNGRFSLARGSIVQTGSAGITGAPSVEVANSSAGKVFFSDLKEGSNNADCAMVEPLPSIVLRQILHPELSTATNTVVDAVEDGTVGKLGKKTGWTTGTVASSNTHFLMEDDILGPINICHGIMIKQTGFASDGDSGAVVFQKNGESWEPIGMVIAGADDLDTPATEHYVGLCSLKYVLEALEERLPEASKPLRFLPRET